MKVKHLDVRNSVLIRAREQLSMGQLAIERSFIKHVEGRIWDTVWTSVWREVASPIEDEVHRMLTVNPNLRNRV